jgi:stage IV sporulation protein FB
VNFLEPQPTPYDVRWRMFGISVRVHPSFWLFSAIFGWSFFQAFGFGYLLIWIACSLVSLLVHELGHVIMGLIFGRSGHIILYSFGGLAVGQYQLARRWQRIAISLAGPGAGFLFLGWIFLTHYLFKFHLLPQIDPRGDFLFLRRGYGGGREPGLGTIYYMLFFMNFFWNAINLIPVFPLDGGQVMRESCEGIFPRQGLRFSLGLSFLVAGMVAVYSFLVRTRPNELWFPPVDPTFNAILFGILAVQNFMMLQDVERQQRWDREDW